MNQLVYKQDIAGRLKSYLLEIKGLRKNNNRKLEYENYRKGKLFYLVKLNCLKQSRKRNRADAFSQDLFGFLDRNIESILIGDVYTLLGISEELNLLFLRQIPEPIIEFYTELEQTNPQRIELTNLLKDYLFVFKKLNTKDRKRVILAVKNKLCPYCSRNYINLIEGVSHNMGVNLDHFYSQKDYPLLGISFFNLIPSCQTCNSAFKGGNELDHSYIHPSIDNLNSARYSLKLNREGEFLAEYFLSKESFEIDFVENFGGKFVQNDFNKFKKSSDFFKIKQIYNSHKEVVQRTLIDYYVYREGEVLESIQKTFPRLNIKHQALGISVNKHDWLYLPFGKLKYDIVSRLVQIDGNNKIDFKKYL